MLFNPLAFSQLKKQGVSHGRCDFRCRKLQKKNLKNLSVLIDCDPGTKKQKL